MNPLKEIALILIATLLLAGCAPAVTPSAVPSIVPTPKGDQPAMPTNAPTVDPKMDVATPLAVEFINQLVKGEFEAATSHFDSAMLKAAPAPKLKEIWTQLLAQLGAFKKQTGTYSATAKDSQIVFVTCEFANGPVDLQVPINPQGQIIGFFVRPAGSGQATAVPPYNPPAYVKTGSYHELQVTVGSGQWALPGTLTLPDGPGPFPAAVLVHGSGPNDRDETIGPNKPFRDLAWGLASQGIAVLRYDKRTKVYGSQFTPEQIAALTVKEETTDDAILAAQLLGQTQGIDPKHIYIVGHSLGALMAPRIGQQLPTLAGLVLLAAPARPLEDVTLDQIIYLAGINGAPSTAAQANIATFETQVARVKSPDLNPSSPATDLPLSLSPVYWLDLRNYSPVETTKSLSMPVLILQGGRDYQVLADKDFNAWQQALSGQKNVTLKLYPDLNHLFISGQAKSVPDEYNQVGHVSEEVVKDITSWILR